MGAAAGLARARGAAACAVQAHAQRACGPLVPAHAHALRGAARGGEVRVAQLAQFRDAAAIGIIADQVPRTSPDRHWTGFLGQDTAFYMGPELLGRALRSQVLFADMRRIARGRYELRFIPLNEPGERLPTGTVTERYARELERAIRDDPPGWWWSHRRWKLTREPLPERAAPAE